MNILLTSVGRRTYLVEYFRAVLRPIGGKVFASNSVKTYALQQADEYTLTPNIYAEKYIDYLLDYCKKNEIKAIISLFDIDLPVLSNNKKLFKAINVDVIVSEPAVIDICNDKWKTYQFLIENNIATPQTFISLSELKDALTSKTISYPLIIKPRWGMGSLSIYKAENELELEIFYNKVKREIQDSYLKFESSQDIEQAIIIQQFISGSEYGIEVINDLSAQYVNTLCKQKIAMRSGETDQAITVDEPKLESLGKKISEKLGHIAMLDTDCFQQDGKFYVLEMNARFGGQYPFSHLAGANIPQQIVDWVLGLQTNPLNVRVISNVLCCKEIQPVIVS